MADYEYWSEAMRRKARAQAVQALRDGRRQTAGPIPAKRGKGAPYRRPSPGSRAE